MSETPAVDNPGHKGHPDFDDPLEADASPELIEEVEKSAERLLTWQTSEIVDESERVYPVSGNLTVTVREISHHDPRFNIDKKIIHFIVDNPSLESDDAILAVGITDGEIDPEWTYVDSERFDPEAFKEVQDPLLNEFAGVIIDTARLLPDGRQRGKAPIPNPNIDELTSLSTRMLLSRDTRSKQTAQRAITTDDGLTINLSTADNTPQGTKLSYEDDIEPRTRVEIFDPKKQAAEIFEVSQDGKAEAYTGTKFDYTKLTSYEESAPISEVGGEDQSNIGPNMQVRFARFSTSEYEERVSQPIRDEKVLGLRIAKVRHANYFIDKLKSLK